MIGINNRDLTTFDADLGASMRLAQRVGHDCLVVNESGISNRGDVELLHSCGMRSFLIGESLLKSTELEAATR